MGVLYEPIFCIFPIRFRQVYIFLTILHYISLKVDLHTLKNQKGYIPSIKLLQTYSMLSVKLIV